MQSRPSPLACGIGRARFVGALSIRFQNAFGALWIRFHNAVDGVDVQIDIKHYANNVCDIAIGVGARPTHADNERFQATIFALDRFAHQIAVIARKLADLLT